MPEADLSRPASELREVAPLAVSFGCALGSYWMLRGMKNAIFMELVGPEWIPMAKMVSISALIVLLMVYGKLVDWLGKRRLLFVVYALYAGLFAALTWVFHSTEGRPSLGWGFYLAIETFGSLGISHLWSLAVNSTPDPAVASRRFPMLVVGGQIGACTCTLMTFLFAQSTGLVPLLVFSIFLLALAPLTARGWLERNHVPDQLQPDIPGEAVGTPGNPPHTGLIEGLRLVLSRPYLLAILGVIVAYEFVGTYFDYQMNFTAKASLDNLGSVTRFLGFYGFLANLLSLVFALTGTGFLVRRFGLSRCLVLYPLLLAGVVLLTAAYPTLWSFFAAMIALKGIAYGFNKPCLEMLYVPTTESIQFKAKSWIDTAGSRSGKALGSVMNAGYPAASLVQAGAVTCLALICGWVFIARWVGTVHARLVQTHDRVS